MLMSASVEDAPFRSVQFRFTPESEKELEPRAGVASFAGLAMSPVVVELLPGSTVREVADIHPDLIVLASLLIVGQTKTASLELPVIPSESMVEAVRERFQIELTTSAVATRGTSERVGSGVPGLAFSGGIDSCAALLLLPKDTVSMFMHRTSLGDSKKTLYNSSAAMASVDALSRGAYRAVALRSNVENIRSPVGFPVDWSNSLPLVINADGLGLSSISFGTVLESATSLGKKKYSDLRDRTVYSRWAPIFKVAGVNMSLPVAGLSEVLTSKVVRERGAFMLPQSCVRGTPGDPCRRCFKCFRKMITEWALGGAEVSEEDISRAAVTREVSTRLSQSPIHHEIGLSWAVLQITSSNCVISALKSRAAVFAASYDSLTFLERPLDVNIDRYIPDDIRPGVRETIFGLLGGPNAADLALVESWDVEEAVASDSYQRGISQTTEALHALSERIN